VFANLQFNREVLMASQTTLTRRWIMSAYRAGKGTREIAAIFGRCESAVRRVRQNERERGTADPLLHLRGRKGKLTAELKARLGRFVTAHPDATLREIKEHLGLDVSLSTIDRWLGKLGLSFKKSPSTPPSRTGPTSRPRARSGGSI
jgi:transposase